MNYILFIDYHLDFIALIILCKIKLEMSFVLDESGTIIEKKIGSSVTKKGLNLDSPRTIQACKELGFLKEDLIKKFQPIQSVT